jgi:hypothetical protein
MFKKISILVLLLTFTLMPVLSSATELRAGEQPTVGQNEKINEDLYIAGGNVTSSGTIVGDLVAGGGNVLIDGSISEDLAVGGGSITILADVGDDIRAGGGSITIAGRVGGDVVMGSGQTQVTGDGIAGDVIWAGGALNISAPVSGNLKLVGGEVLINSIVSGNVKFKGDKLVLGSNAVINGTLTYSSSEEATIKEGAVVVGEITHTKYNGTKDKSSKKKFIAGLISLAILISLLSKLTGALVFGLIFHKYTETLVNKALARPLPELGRGFIVLIIIPVASIFLMITVIGIPLSLFGLIAYAGFMIFSFIMAPVVLGSLVHKWIKKTNTYHVSWKIILLGVVLYMILGIIPVIGWIVKLALILLVLGSVSKMKLDSAKQWR